MIEAMDMPKSPSAKAKAPPRASTKSKDAAAPTRGPGRPKVLADNQTERVVYRAPQAEYERLIELAAEKGYLHRGEGSPGPMLLQLTLAYLTQPRIREVVESSRVLPPPPKRGADPNLEYRNFIRCTPEQRDAIENEALAQGNARAGKGNPAPLIRKVMTRYLHDPSVRLALDAAVQHPAAGGKS